ncbi:hypothetical protein [Arthrobacter sp. JSM 101049]|uniref:hypothetical protein n=1 Tax=Arthrobacter sp. JSM 101049 TaxID=929097 RepID=UPI0035646500
MPEYTTGGIQYPIAGDLIKQDSVEAKLARDMMTLAQTADNAIKVEGERAENAAKVGVLEEVNPRIDDILGTAVFGGDERLLDVSPVAGVFFGVVDAQDRRTVLEVGLDGDFTEQAATRVGRSVGLASVDLDNGPAFAVVDAEDRIIFAPSSGCSTATPALPTSDWAHWGDSLTDDLLTGAQSWTAQLAALTGKQHYNGGWYSQEHDQIAARQGGLPALVTLAGNTTAASGPSTVTAITNSPVLYSPNRAVAGTLAGIPGILAESTADTVIFTPDTPGTYPVPPGSRFTPANGTAYRDRITTIWAGRNGYLNIPVQRTIASTQAMIDYLGPDVKRVIVMEIPPSDTNPIGGPGRAELDAYNAARKAAFPAYWDDTATWLRTAAAAAAAGITWTAQDLTDITNGVTPTSFRSDYIHFNATGCKAIAYRVHQIAQERGWL